MEFAVSGPAEAPIVVDSPAWAVRTAHHVHHGCAHRLVARRYADRGYAGSGGTEPHPEAGLTVCSAFVGDATVGTITVRFDSPQGLLNADAVFAAELAGMRAAGVSLCEFGRLALDQGAGESREVLAHLFHLAYLHAHRLAGCERLVIEVNPRHVAFYRRMLGFEVRSEPRLNPRVNAPAVLLSLDLAWAAQEVERLGGRPELMASSRTLYPLFHGPAEEAELLAKLRQ